MLFQAMDSSSSGSQSNKPQIKYVKLSSSSMMPIRITAVLNGPLAAFLVIYVPYIPKSGRFLILQPVRNMFSHAGTGAPGVAFASYSVDWYRRQPFVPRHAC